MIMIVLSSSSSGESVSVFWTLGPTLLHTTTQRLLPESGRGFFSFQHYWCQKFKDPKPSSKGWKRFCFPFDRNHHCISHTSTLLRSKIQRPNVLFQKVEEVLFSFQQESSLYFTHINITDVKNSKTQRPLLESGGGFVFLSSGIIIVFYTHQHYWCQKFKDPTPSSKEWKRFCFPFQQESSLYFTHIDITVVKNSKTQRLSSKKWKRFCFWSQCNS